MAMENPPFEDVFPIENGWFQCHVSFQGRSAEFLFRVYPGVWFALADDLRTK